VAQTLPFTFTGADLYALCSDAMLKAVTRSARSVDSRVAAINATRASRGQSKISVAYYFDHHSTDADTDVLVTEEDFHRARRDLVPSVSVDELRHYETVRDTFEGKTTKKKDEPKALPASTARMSVDQNGTSNSSAPSRMPPPPPPGHDRNSMIGPGSGRASADQNGSSDSRPSSQSSHSTRAKIVDAMKRLGKAANGAGPGSGSSNGSSANYAPSQQPSAASHTLPPAQMTDNSNHVTDEDDYVVRTDRLTLNNDGSGNALRPVTSRGKTAQQSGKGGKGKMTERNGEVSGGAGGGPVRGSTERNGAEEEDLYD
jgi:peroxin-6